MSRFQISIFIVVLATAVGILAGCDKVPLTSPTGSTITMAIDRNILPINGTAQLTAIVIESAGTAVQNGTTVSFVTSLGRVEPIEVQTLNGKATATFHAGVVSGTAAINAFSGSATTRGSTSDTTTTPGSGVEVKVGGAAAASVAMRATPASLPQSGGTVQVAAIVRDASGNILPGAPVAFTTDQGNLGSTSAVTDANGEAQTTLTTNRDAVVTATVFGDVKATTNVRIINAPTVQISSSTTTPGVGVGVNFTVTPGAAASGTPIQNATVDFGDGTGVQNLGAISGATNVTHTFNSPGSYTVIASVTDATGQQSSSSISIVVQRISPTVTLTPPTSSISAGSALAFSVAAAPGTGGPPLQNVTVRLNPGGSVVYSGSGSGSFTQQFNSPGTYTLTATATDSAGTTGTGSAVVNVTGRGAIEMTLDAFSSTTNAYTCFPASSYPKTCSGVDLKAGTAVSLQAGFVGTAPTNIVSYTWNFADGQTQTTTTRNTSHTFSGGGNYVVTVTVNTGDGGSGSQQITLLVGP